MTDQNNDTKTMVYDLASRLLERQYPDSLNDVFTYDSASRLLTATSNRYNNVVSYQYDAASRLTSESTSYQGQTYSTGYEYDLSNRLKKLIYPDGSEVDRTYTARDQLATLVYKTSGTDPGPGTTISTNTYDAGMRKTSMTRGNGLATNLTYRADNLYTSIDHVGVSTLSYSWDANKNKTAENFTGALASSSKTHAFDDEDRLTNMTRTDGLTRDFALSLVGDMNTVTTNGTPETRGHSDAHEITDINGNTLSYDPKGNLTSDPIRNQTYTFDFDNKLSVADLGAGKSAEYIYDALGRRLAKKLIEIGQPNEWIVYAYSGARGLSEYEATPGSDPSTINPSTDVAHSYVYGSYIDEPCAMIIPDGDGPGDDKIIYYHQNQQFSTVAMSDESGSVIELYKYDAHGGVTIYAADGVTERTESIVGNTYLYTGRRFDDETGLYYFRARYYDSTLQRFISRDPLGYVDGMSLYRDYFGPGMMDPWGLLLNGEPGGRPSKSETASEKKARREQNAKTAASIDDFFGNIQQEIHSWTLPAKYIASTSTALAQNHVKVIHKVATLNGNDIRDSYVADVEALEEHGNSSFDAHKTSILYRTPILRSVFVIGEAITNTSLKPATAGQDLGLDPMERIGMAAGGISEAAGGAAGTLSLTRNILTGLKSFNSGLRDTYPKRGTSADSVFDQGLSFGDEPILNPLPEPTPINPNVTIAGRGSTANSSAVRSLPRTFKEQLAVWEAMANPKLGTLALKGPLGDPRWPATDGWVKYRQNINGIEVHYLFNTKTGMIDDFKVCD